MMIASLFISNPYSFQEIQIVIQTIIATLKATNLPIETENPSGIKLRGVFNNQSIIICADNYQQEVLFLSTSFPAQRKYSYSEFFLKFCC